MSVIGHDMNDFNLAVNTHQDPRRAIVIPAGTDRHLFVDDFYLALGSNPGEYPLNIRWVTGSVAKHGEPIFEGKPPSEEGSAWFSVAKEGGIYRMWYNSNHKQRRGMFVSYAESSDGVNFERKNVGSVEIDGLDENNVVFDGGLNGISPEMGNIFIDPNALEGERYKMIYTDWAGPEVFELPFTHNVGMLRGAASPDGIKWTRYYDNFTGRYCDSQNSACWDATLGSYVVYHRSTGAYGGVEAEHYRIPAERRGRAVGRLISTDYRNWESTGIALQADFADGLNTDIYNSAYSRYPHSPNLHFLFPSFYRHYEGVFEVQVCTSRDNRSWFRACRNTYVPLGSPGEFDSFIVSVCPGFVEVDSDTFALYYRSGDGPHGGSRPFELDYQPRSRMSRVTFKRDRIVGIEAGGEEGQFITRPMQLGGPKILVNFEPITPEAKLKAQLVSIHTKEPVPGYSFDDCTPVTTDGLDSVVRWKDHPTIGAEVLAKPVRLHFRFNDARLYAFQAAE